MPDSTDGLPYIHGAAPSLEHCLTPMCQHCGWLHRHSTDLESEVAELRVLLAQMIIDATAALPSGTRHLDREAAALLLDTARRAQAYLLQTE